MQSLGLLTGSARARAGTGARSRLPHGAAARYLRAS
jgi:hypothetical protein